MKKEERINRIIAKGEVTGHSHIVTGDCTIERENETVVIKAGKNCAIKHLLEQPFVEEGVETWTEEHNDISLNEGESYSFVQQVEFDPYNETIIKIKD